VSVGGEWVDVSRFMVLDQPERSDNPLIIATYFNDNSECVAVYAAKVPYLRNKPETKKFRVALFKGGYTYYVDSEIKAESLPINIEFKRWLTDWIEYEV
jgi:hypothetical protein